MAGERLRPWAPGRIPAGGTSDELTSTLDLLPTIATLTALSGQPDHGREFIIRNADKLIFGTDAGWWSFSKIPATEKEWTYFETLNLPAEVKNKIYRKNAAKLLKLEPK